MTMFDNLSDRDKTVARHLIGWLHEHNGVPISYKDFALYIHEKEGGNPVSNHGKGLWIHWHALNGPLGGIADVCIEHSHPLLPSLVVYQGKEYSGDGFYEKYDAAYGHTRTEPYSTADKNDFSKSERQECLKRFAR